MYSHVRDKKNGNLKVIARGMGKDGCRNSDGGGITTISISSGGESSCMT